jgi:SAM-dependent methyltransferase
LSRATRRARRSRSASIAEHSRQLYDTLGRGYRRFRRPDPRIAAAIEGALGDAASAANVGAGAGSYEPRGRKVVAVEPSLTMIRQRAQGAAPVVRALAAALPFRDASFDAALAVLTIHHWPERARGLAELARAARRRVVILTHDPAADGFWLEDYFPALFQIGRAILPSLDELRRAFGRIRILDVPIPRDCQDGFQGAYWCRPERYLDAEARSAISSFARLEPGDLASGLARLRGDLASGEWERRHGALREQSALDLGYRLVVAESA